jgi:hypothetical protein
MPVSFLRTIYRSVAWLALGLGLVACATSGEPAAEEEPTDSPTATTHSTLVLPDLGPAPDITNEIWLNTERPLNLDALRGQVVLVEFWTFG